MYQITRLWFFEYGIHSGAGIPSSIRCSCAGGDTFGDPAMSTVFLWVDQLHLGFFFLSLLFSHHSCWKCSCIQVVWIFNPKAGCLATDLFFESGSITHQQQSTLKLPSPIYTYIYIYTFIYFPCAAAANMAMTMLHLHASMVFFPTENKEIPWKCWKLSDWHPVSCLKRLQCLSLQLSSGEISENEVGRPLNEVVWAGKWWGKRESQPGTCDRLPWRPHGMVTWNTTSQLWFPASRFLDIHVSGQIMRASIIVSRSCIHLSAR